MSRFEFVVEQTERLLCYVEADNIDEAYDKYYDGDRTDFDEIKFCDEHILSVIDVTHEVE